MAIKYENAKKSGFKLDPSKVSVDSVEIERQRSDFTKRLGSLMHDYEDEAEQRRRFAAGEKSKYDDYQLPGGAQLTSDNYKTRASELKQELEEKKHLYSAQEYLAQMRRLNQFTEGDFSDYDKSFSDTFNAYNSVNGYDNYKKAIEAYLKNQNTLKKAGITESSGYTDIEKALANGSFDQSEKAYLTNLMQSKVDTLSKDEVQKRASGGTAETEAIQKSNKETARKVGAALIDLSTYRDGINTEDELNSWLSTIKAFDAENGTNYADLFESNALTPEKAVELSDELMLPYSNSKYSKSDVAYYEKEYDKNGKLVSVKPVSWSDYYYERDTGAAYKELTSGKNAATEYSKKLFNEIKDTNDIISNLDWVKNNKHTEKTGQEWNQMQTVLSKQKKAFSKATGHDFDDIEYYEDLQLDKARAADVDAGVDAAIDSTGGFAPIMSIAARIPFSLVSGFEALDNMISGIGHTDGGTSSYRPVNTYDDYATNISNRLSEKSTEKIQTSLENMGVSRPLTKLAVMTYGGLDSGINSIATVAGSIALFGPQAGQVVASTILSGQAASSAVHDAVENGSTSGEALAYGFASGVAEYLGEKVSIGSLVDKYLNSSVDGSGFKNWLKGQMKDFPKTLAQGAVEGSEEVFTEILNRLADNIINADHTQLKNAVYTYVENGMTEEEAKKAAFKDFLANVAEQAYGGFIGGMVGGTISNAAGGVRAARNTVSNTKNQIALGKLLGDTETIEQLKSLGAQNDIRTDKIGQQDETGKKTGVSKLFSKVKETVEDRRIGKLAQDVVAAEFTNAQKAAIEVLGEDNRNLATAIAGIATGTADNSILSVFIDLVDNSNTDKVEEAFSAIRKNTNSNVVQAILGKLLGDNVDSKNTAANSEYGEYAKKMSSEDLAEMDSAYQKYGKGMDKNHFSVKWNYFRALGEAGYDSQSSRYINAKESDIGFTDDDSLNNVLASSALMQGFKAYRKAAAKNTAAQAAQRVVANRGRAKGLVSGAKTLADNTTGKAAKTLANTLARLGYDVVFESSENSKVLTGTKNGAYDSSTNTIYLKSDAEYNRSSTKTILAQTLSHEIVHSVKVWNKEGYTQLQKYVMEAMGEDQFDTLLAEKLTGDDYSAAYDEVIADSCEMLLRDSKALEKIARENASLFVKIKEAVQSFIDKLKKALKEAYGDTGELHSAAEALKLSLSDMTEIQQLFDDVLYKSISNMKNALAEAENAKTRGNLEILENAAEKEKLKYSIEYTTDNKPVAIIDNDILDGVPKSQWIQTVKDTILNKFAGGIPISGRLIKVNKISRNEFTNSRNSRRYANNNQVIYADKFKSANNLDDIVLASTNYINEELKHSRKDKFTEFARGNVLIKVGDTEYSAKVIVGFTSGKQMVLYDVVDFSQTSFEIKKTDASSPSNRINAENSSNTSVSNTMISETEQNVKTKFEFSEETDDVQYSEETNGTDPHSILLADMEMTAKTQTEKNFVEKYRENVEKVVELETELEYLNSEIKEISFTKGSDRSRLASLNARKKAVLYQINLFDSKLTEYRGYKVFQNMIDRNNARQKAEERKLRNKIKRELLDKAIELAERRRKKDVMSDIAKRLTEIDRLASSDTRHKHLPSATVELVARMRTSLDNGTQDYGAKIEAAEDAIAKYKDDIKQYKATLDSGKGNESSLKSSIASREKWIAQKEAVIQTYKERAEKAAEMIEQMKSFYAEYAPEKSEEKKSTYELPDDEYEAVANRIESTAKMIDGRAFYQLNLSELKEVLDTVKIVRKTISNANKLFGETRSLKAVGETVEKELGGRQEKRDRGAATRDIGKFAGSLLKPAQLFEGTGSATLMKYYRELQDGEVKSANLIFKYQKAFQTAAEKNGVTRKQLEKLSQPIEIDVSSTRASLEKDIDDLGKNISELKEKKAEATEEKAKKKLDSQIKKAKEALAGKKKWLGSLLRQQGDKAMVTMTMNEALSFYATSKRKQGMQHLLSKDGGFSIGGEGKIRRGNGKMYKNASLMKVNSEVVKTIIDSIPQNLRTFADEVQQYMSTELSADGNEISMQLWDINLFKEDNYFPLTISQDGYLKTEKAGKESRSLTFGWLNETNPNATGGVVILPFTEVWAKHAKEMATWSSFALPLENMKKLLNVKVDGGRVNNLIGDVRREQIGKFLVDVSGGIRSDDNSFSSRLFNKWKAAKVSFNLSVAIQQPWAVIRAFSEIGPKYFVGKNPNKMSGAEKAKIQDEMRQYTVWSVKELGGVDMNTSASLTERLQDLGKGEKQSAKALNKVREAGFFGAEMGDKVAWMCLWQACKREAAAQQYTGEDMLKKAGKRFNYIANKTQVYDSVFSRAGIMRTKNQFAAQFTAFMAEPITTLNMMTEAVQQFWSGSKRKAARIISSVLLAEIVTKVFRSFVDAIRDDDDDETYTEKYAEALAANIADSLNPFAYIPGAKDLNSILQGYSVNRSELDGIEDLANNIKRIQKQWERDGGLKNFASADSVIYDALASFIDLSGQGASSLKRDVTAIVNTAADIFAKTGKWDETTKTNMKNKVLESLISSLPGSLFYSKEKTPDSLIYYAFTHGDEKYIEQAKELYGEDKFNNYVVNGLKKEDFRVDNAAAAHLDGNTSEYLRLINEIVGDGFARESVQKAVLSLENEQRDDGDKVRAIDGLTVTKDDILNAVEDGDYEYLEDYYKAKIESRKRSDEEEGKERDEDEYESLALSSVRSLLTEYYKPVYRAADSEEREELEEKLRGIEVDGETVYPSRKAIRRWEND